MLVKHIVLIQFKETCDSNRIDELTRAFASLQVSISGIGSKKYKHINRVAESAIALQIRQTLKDANTPTNTKLKTSLFDSRNILGFEVEMV